MAHHIEKLITFAKAQISAFAGGVVDYLAMIVATELLGIHFTLSIVIGGIIGAAINFFINKGWTFHSKKSPYRYAFLRQLIRFMVVVFNSIFLKASGTFFITYTWLLDYKLSRLIADLLVSVVFNYTLQRFWVFQRKEHPIN